MNGDTSGITLAAGLPIIRASSDKGACLDVPWLPAGSIADADPATLPVVLPWGELEALAGSADKEAGLIWLRQHLRIVGDVVRAKADRLMKEEGWTRPRAGKSMHVTAADLSGTVGAHLRRPGGAA